MAEESARPRPQGLRRPIFTLLRQTTVVLVLLTACYYTLPLRFTLSEITDLVRVAVTAALLGVVFLVFRTHARRSRRILGKNLAEIEWLLSALYLLVLTFAVVYTFVARVEPSQFVGIDDRTAALYFSVTVMATVGFGDIHATGTFGQVLVTAQMIFNLVYLGTALRLLSRRAESGAPPF